MNTDRSDSSLLVQGFRAGECDVCGSPEGVLCDVCADEEREQDLARAERLAEEDRFLYGM